MHRIGSRCYVGEPSETVRVTTRVSKDGHVCVCVNGEDIGPDPEFQLPNNPGGRAEWQVQLSGKPQTTCRVEIRTVDGSFDDDLLICLPHTPSPVHIFECAVVKPSARRAFTHGRAARASNARAGTKAAKSAKKSTGTKGSAKKKATTRAGKKRRAARAAKKGSRS